ncbi:hypothetical protein [Nitrosospira sp. Nsp11]|uniref:hypothetical protein n=1 Tax=Nitrosospira sp. Nsp11 TaxID=1855338 RepID=UPI0015B37FBC|nr:hypothetical protein [Nitrosospira sp. Nsp11]
MSRKLSCAVKIGTGLSGRGGAISGELPGRCGGSIASIGPSDAKPELMSVTGKPGGKVEALILSKRVYGDPRLLRYCYVAKPQVLSAAKRLTTTIE